MRVIWTRARAAQNAVALSILAIAQTCIGASTGVYADEPSFCAEEMAARSSSRSAVPSPKLGVQVWPGEIRPDNELLLGLYPAAFRYGAGPSWPNEAPLPVDQSYASILAYVKKTFEAKNKLYLAQARQIAAFAKATKGEAYFVIWKPPITSEEAGAHVDPRGARTLARVSVTATATFYVALLKTLNEYGYPLDEVEIANEPDGEWSIRISPLNYLAVLSEFRRVALANDVKLPRISGPGTSTIAAMTNYLKDASTAQQILANVDDVSVHAWDDRTNKDVVVDAQLAISRLKELGYSKSVIVSEFSVTFLLPQDRESGRGALKRSNTAVSESSVYAAKVLNTALRLSSIGFRPILYWQFHDESWGHDSYGLYRVDGTVRPTEPLWQSLARYTTFYPHGCIKELSADTFVLSNGPKRRTLIVTNTLARPNVVVLPSTLVTSDNGPFKRCEVQSKGLIDLVPGEVCSLELQ